MILINKTVCIVSYAQYMHNKKYGSLIDTYDVVVRINNGINILNTTDLGTKTNICSLFFGEGKLKNIVGTYNDLIKIETEKINNIVEIINKHKLICLTQYCVYKSFLDKNNLKLNILYLDIDTYINHLTSGISTIIHILYLKPKLLYLTGFSFNNFIYPGYDEFCFKYKKISFDRLNKNYSDWNSPHSENFEKYIIKKLSIKYKNIKFDNEMTDILNEINIDKLDYNIYYNKTYIEHFNLICNLI